MKIPFRKTRDGVSLTIKVQPRASRSGIRGIAGEVVKVALTAPPVDGQANEQLIEVLARELGVKKGAIRLMKGLASRQKVVEVIGVDRIGD